MANESRYLFILTHSSQIDWYSVFATGFKEHGEQYKTVVFVHGEADALKARARGCYDHVVDFLDGFTPGAGAPRQTVQASPRICELEQKLSRSFFWEDIKTDRWARPAPDKKLVVQYMNHAVDILTNMYHRYNPVAALGEYTMAIYRYAHSLFEADSKLMFYPVTTRYYGRLYFETDIYWRWEACIALYKDYITNGLPASVREEIYPFYVRIAEKRDSRPGYTVHQNQFSAGYTAIGSLPFKIFLRKIIGAFSIASVDRRNIRDLVIETSYREKVSRVVRERIAHYRYSRLVKSDFPRDIPYAVYFLHYQPEYTSDALGHFYQDQRHLIRAIASSLPADMYLVVKEHPTMIGLRDLDYYTDLLNIPNVVLVHHSNDSLTLISNSRIVFTIVGTPALEAMFIGKPAIMFGKYAFSQTNTISLCENLSSLGGLVREKLSTRYDQAELMKHSIALLAAKYMSSRPGQIPVAIELIQDFLESEDQFKLVKNAFSDELREKGLLP